MNSIIFLVIYILVQQIFSIGTLNGTSYPLPRLNILSKSDAFYSGQTIILDASSSYLPPLASDASYYFKFDIGTDTVQTVGNPRVSRVFTTGIYDILLTINDQPFNQTGSYAYGKTLGGYPAPSVGLSLEILPRKHCYGFNVSIDWNSYVIGTPEYLKPYGGGDISLYISHSRISLSNVYESIGESPNLKISNGTHDFEFTGSNFTYQNGRWKIVLPFEYFNGSWPVVGIVESKSQSIQSCTIETKKVDLTFPWIQSLQFGYDMDNYEANGIKSGILLNSSQYVPNNFKLQFDHCNRKQGIATFGVSPSSGNSSFLGSLAAITSSYFENYTLVDLSRSADNHYISSTSLCFDLNLKECSGLRIMDTLIIKSHLFILTDKGLFVSQQFLSGTNKTSTAIYRQIFPRPGSIDYTTNSVLASVRVFGKSDCLDASNNYVFIMLKNASSVLLYTTVEEIDNSQNPDWTEVTLNMINVSDNTTVFFDALRDVLNQKNVYLIGNPLMENDQIICSANSSCSIDHASVIIDKGDGSPQISFSFPPALIIYGIELHSKTNNLFVYGAQIWLSSDGGFTFYAVHQSLTSNIEIFSQFSSEVYSDTYILRTNLNRIFYGNGGSGHLLEVKSITSHEAELMMVSTDNLGGFWSFSIPKIFSGFVNSYGAILLRSQGQTPFISKRRIPIIFEKLALTESYGFTLIPIFNGLYYVQFYINGTDAISTELSGYRINHENGGDFSITHVSDDGKNLFGILNSPFIPELSIVSPAISGILSVVGLTNELDVVESSYPSQPLNRVQMIISNISSSGWLLSDIGKTVVFHTGSIIVLDVINSTLADGLVISSPVNSADARAGTWEMYDFRSYTEYPTQKGADLIVNTNSSGTFAFYTAGFSEDLDIRQMYLITDSSGWGAVNYLGNRNYMYITTFSPIIDGIYHASSWKLVNSWPKFSAGSLPLVKDLTRKWSFKLDNCPIISSNTSITHPIQYIGFDGTLWYQSSVQFSRRKNFSVIPEVDLEFVNWELFSRNVSRYWNPSFMQSEVNVSLRDNGATGPLLLKLKPSLNSLSCDSGLDTVYLLNSCQSNRFLYLQRNISENDFLYGSLYDTEISSYLVEELPYNYRPPSSYGSSIPVSSNIYNGAPDQARFRDTFSVSKTSGTYKHCKGKADREACQCTDMERFSMDSSNSDCIDRVIRVPYFSPYAPKLYISENGLKTPLNGRYSISEVNGRIDYCISSMNNCKNQSALTGAIINPENKDFITWGGSELYHFRVILVDREYCNMSTEFILYVYNTPPSTGREWLAMSVSGLSFGLLLLSLYIFIVIPGIRTNHNF